MRRSTFNRREAALTVAAMGAVFASPIRVLAQGATLGWTPRGLTPPQARVLDAVAELIIPATDTPGAREAGVPKFVDQAVADYCTAADAVAIRAGLDRAEADAKARHGKAFVDLTPAEQTTILMVYDAEGRAPRTAAPAVTGRGDTETGLSNRPATPTPTVRPFFPVLKDLVTASYFTSQLGATRAVRWDPNPGAYHGCVPLKDIGRAWAI
jgi:hypothetical protein